MGSVDLNALIPNNVDLKEDRRLQRALEAWQPQFLDWWREMGPEGFQADEVYLRTAVDVGRDGWAHFDYVKMPDYRWGIFMSPAEDGRVVPCGDHFGDAAWQKVPGEYRNALRRIIVTQADTEPASVEQQRLLGQTAPSQYDLRNLFQVNVEEGRHLWAMVYLLHTHFGRDGREEAEDLLRRRSGNQDSPRILGTFNEPVEDWLSFFMFTTFTDRDGKFQLLALAESGFDPLSRTTRFMLTEEAHHMFVGETGVGRIIERSAQVMNELGTDEPDRIRAHGAIDLPTIQRWLNRWYSSSINLFGGEQSSNAASYFATGLKGRYKEDSYEDHIALEGVYRMQVPQNLGLTTEEVPLRNAMNEILRDGYIGDCEFVIARWNRILEKAGRPERMELPNRRFNREMGIYSSYAYDPEGNPITAEAFEARRDDWLPSEADSVFVKSLMKPCLEFGKVAGWIAPPRKGINGNAFEWEYVRFDKSSAGIACGATPSLTGE
ncbi:MAG: benzoyl-CoA 2,3-epoxidase subunit BoxB [Planctomycetota bacterium]|nr:benzoyl-CoA 2,3-epoxidase subunit BoxB [Planctomycetota bacterium]